MRNTALLKCRFFIAGTGNQILREHGREVALTALYLIAGPHSHMCGLYYLPTGTAADELGISTERFDRDLAILEGIGFCR
jgi:hypothetical protein